MNNQPKDLNVLQNIPLIYSTPPIANLQTTTLFPPYQITQIPNGINNIVYPVIPIILSQSNIQNTPLYFQNNLIPNYQNSNSNVLYQMINGQIIPIQQYNNFPNNKSAFNEIKKIEEKEKLLNGSVNRLIKHFNQQNYNPLESISMINIQSSINNSKNNQSYLQNQKEVINNNIINGQKMNKNQQKGDEKPDNNKMIIDKNPYNKNILFSDNNSKNNSLINEENTWFLKYRMVLIN